jgi:hypothetical protein
MSDDRYDGRPTYRRMSRPKKILLVMKPDEGNIGAMLSTYIAAQGPTVYLETDPVKAMAVAETGRHDTIITGAGYKGFIEELIDNPRTHDRFTIAVSIDGSAADLTFRTYRKLIEHAKTIWTAEGYRGSEQRMQQSITPTSGLERTLTDTQP